MTTATQHEHDNAHEAVLFLAFELGDNTWTLGFAPGQGQKPRERTSAARDPHACSTKWPVPHRACYEPGREGFWRHRFRQAQGMTNYVMKSSEVKRRKRRARSDGLEVRKLLRS
jgi:transposase